MQIFNKPFNSPYRYKKYTTTALISSGSGDTPIVYSVSAYVSGFISPSATGTSSISTVPFQPKLVSFMDILFSNSTNASSTDGYFSNGYSTVNKNISTSINSQYGVTTTNADKRHDNVNSINNINLGGATLEEAYISSFTPSGFNILTTKASSRNHHYFALGGTVEVNITEQQMNATNSGQSFAHGMSSAPDLVLFLGVNSTVTPPETSTNARLIFGAANNSGQQMGGSFYSANGQTTSITRRVLSNNRVAMYIDSAGIQRSMAVSGIDATNVHVTYPTTADTNQWRFFMIAMKGCKSQVGTFDLNGNLTPSGISCSGITPKLFISLLVPQGVDSNNTTLTNNIITMGFSDGTRTTSMGMFDSNGETTTAVGMWQMNSGLAEYSVSAGTQALRFNAGVAFSGQSVRLSPNTYSSSVYGQGGYIIIGD